MSIQLTDNLFFVRQTRGRLGFPFFGTGSADRLYSYLLGNVMFPFLSITTYSIIKNEAIRAMKEPK